MRDHNVIVPYAMFGTVLQKLLLWWIFSAILRDRAFFCALPSHPLSAFHFALEAESGDRHSMI